MFIIQKKKIKNVNKHIYLEKEKNIPTSSSRALQMQKREWKDKKRMRETAEKKTNQEEELV